MQAANNIYHPLDPSNHEIRLLESLNPEDYELPEGHLYFMLTHHSLDDNPVSLALSYTWGKPFLPKQVEDMTDAMLEACDLLEPLSDAPRSVFINGDGKKVKNSLWDALAMFPTWRSIPSMPFWIDALCINQDENDEKSVQVQQMHKIYGQAAYVISWLGPEANRSEHAIAFLKNMGKLSIGNIQRGIDIEQKFNWLA